MEKIKLECKCGYVEKMEPLNCTFILIHCPECKKEITWRRQKNAKKFGRVLGLVLCLFLGLSGGVCAKTDAILFITVENTEKGITFDEWQAEGMPEIIIIGDTHCYTTPEVESERD